MNKSILNKKLLGSLLLAMALSACKSTPMVDKPAAVEDKSPQTAAAPAAPRRPRARRNAPARPCRTRARAAGRAYPCPPRLLRNGSKG